MEIYKTKSQLWNKIGANQQAGCKVEGDVRKVLEKPKIREGITELYLVI